MKRVDVSNQTTEQRQQRRETFAQRMERVQREARAEQNRRTDRQS